MQREYASKARLLKAFYNTFSCASQKSVIEELLDPPEDVNLWISTLFFLYSQKNHLHIHRINPCFHHIDAAFESESVQNTNTKSSTKSFDSGTITRTMHTVVGMCPIREGGLESESGYI